jgi:hypothetical protein
MLACALLASLASDTTAATQPHMRYLFSYFVNEHDGLHLAWSDDGLKWHAFMHGGHERIFLQPTAGRDKLMRDPCLLLGPDGIFRLVWTDSWRDKTLGYASSKDLIHWSDEKTVPVMAHEPTARNVWAPEVFYDAATARYLILWSSTIPGRFPETAGVTEDDFNHRFYATTTTDFVTYSPTKLFFDPGFCAIDATHLPFEGKSWMIFKNETLKPHPAKDLFLAGAPTMMGPYGHLTGPIPTRPPHWVEGPTALRVGDRILLYYDCYQEGHFGAAATTDLRHWTDVTPQLSMPKGIRHGTALAVPDAVVANLLALP